MTLPLARELSEHGIRAMTIAPGLFETPMMAGLPDKVTEALIKKTVFPKRMAKPVEFAMMVFEGQEITFRDLQEDVNRASQFLMDLGVQPVDHVAMLPTASPEFAHVYFATLQVGAVINPLNLASGVAS